MKTSERIGLLMFRYMRNELSRGEARELLAWRNKSAKHENAFQEATDWENVRADLQWSDDNSNSILEKIKVRYPEPWEKKEEIPVIRFSRFLSAATVLALVMGAVFSYINHQKTAIVPGTYSASIISPDGSKDEFGTGPVHDFIRGFKAGYAGVKVVEHENGQVEYIARNFPKAARDKSFELLTFRGNAFELQLPDIGSIWVNASTDIWYPANLSVDTIRIKLTGEACFNINANRHLIIEIPSATDREPSTFISENGLFNVHAYPPDPAISQPRCPVAGLEKRGDLL